MPPSESKGVKNDEGDVKNKHETSYPLQMPFPEEVLYRKPFATLPSNVAIPVGLAQVFIGGSMVVCGSLALRYRSYLFYYGTGLWAGTISSITGALMVMATKEGLPKPRWLCGGRKWQIHVVIAATMLAMTASVLMSVFSTSGLMQDTMHSVGVELGTPTKDDERFERRKSSGVAINAILLLLAMLEILLSFCSLGIALRILCRSQSTSSLFSVDSSGSQVTMHDILGTGPEYEARKDRLLRWLGHQRRNFFLASTPKTQQRQIAKFAPNISPSIISTTGRKRTQGHVTGLVPHLIAVQPPPQRLIPHPHVGPPPRSVFIGNHHPSSRAYGYPVMVPVPLCPAPVTMRRPMTPARLDVATLENKRRRKEIHGGSNNNSLSSGSKGSKRSHRSTNQRRRPKHEESKVVEITEEEIGKTYTGLDRTVAVDFISNSMDKY